jgi:cytidylate kinase
MTIVMISSMHQSGREDLAQALTRKTGWPVLSREEMLDGARKLGIKMGRLEMAILKAPGLSEKLAREKEIYLAFLTATLCEKARRGNLIYHGRAGHLLLPGVSHRLRVGLTAPQEVRIKRTAQALNITPDKAETYLSQLDEDVAKWIRYIHRVDGRDPNHFDLFFNLENMGLSNAAGILCSTAELPDFQPTPASLKLMEDLNLSSQAKLRLALDERTLPADLQVHADNGVVTVTYPPDQAKVAPYIPQVLTELPGCREIQCTMAETTILWVQERFEPKSENFGRIIRLAQRWGAAVELMRLIPPEEAPAIAEGLTGKSEYGYGRRECALADDGGVQDDDPEHVTDDGGLDRTQEELVDLGRFGGRHTICGGYDHVLARVQSSGRYTLVVIGDMFMSKGHSARTRQTRELALNIRDRLKAPVITADELKSQLLFGKRQAAALLGYIVLTIFIYVGVFANQKPVMDFLGGSLHQNFKVLAAVAVAVFSPVLAFVYGNVSGLTLKIINVD